MKNKSYIGLGVIILVFSFWFLPKIFNTISDNKTVDSNRTKSIDQSSKLSFIKLNGSSRKVPDFIFLNQDNIYIGNEDFLGKVYVAEFFFTSCPSICIEMNQNMKILDDEFGNRDDFGIASFTIDPINDTPQILKEYSERLNVKSKNWHFLTGEIDSIKSICEDGFLLFSRNLPEGHAIKFVLIDHKGQIRKYYDGTDRDEMLNIQKDIDRFVKISRVTDEA